MTSLQEMPTEEISTEQQISRPRRLRLIPVATLALTVALGGCHREDSNGYPIWTFEQLGTAQEETDPHKNDCEPGAKVRVDGAQVTLVGGKHYNAHPQAKATPSIGVEFKVAPPPGSPIDGRVGIITGQFATAPHCDIVSAAFQQTSAPK